MTAHGPDRHPPGAGVGKPAASHGAPADRPGPLNGSARVYVRASALRIPGAADGWAPLAPDARAAMAALGAWADEVIVLGAPGAADAAALRDLVSEWRPQPHAGDRGSWLLTDDPVDAAEARTSGLRCLLVAAASGAATATTGARASRGPVARDLMAAAYGIVHAEAHPMAPAAARPASAARRALVERAGPRPGDVRP
jgi:hypothetical protein